MLTARPWVRRVTGAVLVLGLVATAACSSSDAEADPQAVSDVQPDTTSTTEPPELLALDGAEAAAFTVESSVEQLLVTGAVPGQSLQVADGDDVLVGAGTADESGSFLARYLVPGAGYRVVSEDGGTLVASEATEVWAVDDVPPADLYSSQVIGEGFDYVETRDGTLLAVNVTLPGPPEDGPYPTVIEYSGYDPANPRSLQPSKLLASFFGYATVGVNMRGTGCSGGSFLFFEPVQSTDGYDVVEAVAAQPWVQGNRVGMIGLSYPGISQLFVAQTRPPSLAAIAPLSVIEDTYRSTLYPGGILNDGFATAWADERQADAAPRGQAWAGERIDAGDETCAANQALRSQNPDLFEFIDSANHSPEDRTGYVGRLAPVEWVDDIDVPVFLIGAWQDEQTGGRFPEMLDRFTSAPVVRFTMTNGGHTEAFSPDLIVRWSEFLDLYVAERVPQMPDGFTNALGVIGGAVFEGPLDVPVDPPPAFGSYEEARAAYEAGPPVRIRFENGAGASPGYPLPSVEVGFDAWPIPELEATTWHFGPDGTLLPDPPGTEQVDAYTYDTSRSQQSSLPSNDPWVMLPGWDWQGPADGAALAYASEPLTSTLVMAGPGRIDLRFGSSAPDVDIQVTLSEIRADGTEVYVQNGWLRASHRALDEDRSTPLRPSHTHLERDVAELPEEELTEVSVELFPFAHVFREGSQVRLSIEGPGGTRPEWTFAALDAPEGTENQVGIGGSNPSRLTLPVVPGVEVPADAPPCPSLRGQPCRPLVALTNRTAR